MDELLNSATNYLAAHPRLTAAILITGWLIVAAMEQVPNV